MDTHAQKALKPKPCQQITVLVVKILVLKNDGIVGHGVQYFDGRSWSPLMAADLRGEPLPEDDYDVRFTQPLLAVAATTVQ